MRKLKYSRLYTFDLFSCYKLRELRLNLGKTQTKNKLFVKVSWTAQQKLNQDLSFGYDYPAWKSLANQKKSTNRFLSIPLANFNIKTRYVQIEVSFTVHPFTACKEEIHNLADNEIIPSLFGSYVG